MDALLIYTYGCQYADDMPPYPSIAAEITDDIISFVCPDPKTLCACALASHCYQLVATIYCITSRSVLLRLTMFLSIAFCVTMPCNHISAISSPYTTTNGTPTWIKRSSLHAGFDSSSTLPVTLPSLRSLTLWNCFCPTRSPSYGAAFLLGSTFTYLHTLSLVNDLFPSFLQFRRFFSVLVP